MARVLALVFAVLLCFGAPAAAAPGTQVIDRSGTLTAGQLDGLKAALSELQYPFHVLVVDTIWPGGKPANAQAEFEAYAHKYLNEQVPRDAVLMIVSLKDRLVDMRVYTNGPVNQRLQERTGRAFMDHYPAIVEAYRTPARAGDIPGGIVAAARYLHGLVPPGAAPAVTPVPTPAPAPTPSPVVVPPPDPQSPPLVVAQPEPSPQLFPAPPVRQRSNPWPFVGGFALLVGLGFWTRYFWRYRKARVAALVTRDRFLGELLHLMERELPLAAKYTGEETRAAVGATAEQADAALRIEQAGEELRKQAEGRARFSRMVSAAALMAQAEAEYTKAEAAFRSATEAWAPVSDALRTWDELQGQVGGVVAQTGAALSAEKVRTGWPLEALGARLQREEARLALARSSRDTDPVKTLRLTRETGAASEVLLADVGSMVSLTAALEEQRLRLRDVNYQIDEARRTLGLRFVELSPDPGLARSGAAEADAAAALPPGEVERVRQALVTARTGSDEAMEILERYREALRVYPLKSTELSRQLTALPGEEQQATATLADLRARYDDEDWADVRDLAAELSAFTASGRDALAEVTRMTSPAVQLYLRTVELLDEMLSRREALRVKQATLAARPAELGELAGKARQELATWDGLLAEAQQIAVRSSLVLPREVAAQLDEARRNYRLAEQQGRELPLPVHRWHRAAAEGAALAADVRQAVLEVERLATSARAELARAQAEAGSALGYERYDHRGHAVSLRGALSAAEMALAAGQYHAVLTEAGRALEASRGLEMAYREYVAAQMEEERQRREAEEAARRSSEASSSFSSSSGGTSSFDSGSSSSSSSSSSSDNSSSGGTSSW